MTINNNKILKLLAAAVIVIVMVIVLIQTPKFESIKNFQSSPPKKSAPTTLFFAGDIMLSRNVDDKMEKASDFSLPFRQVADEISNADIAFANLESPFSDKGRHFIPNSLIFNADPRAIEGLNLAGFDVLSTANNHSLDQGAYGISFTYDWLAKHNIIPVGTGVPAIDVTQAVIQKNKINFGFLSYTYTAYNNGTNDSNPVLGNFNDLNQLKQDIWTLKGHYSDAVIVNMHAGTEYTRTPSQKQIEFAHAAIEAGADLVIGEHPHWIQTIEQYQGRWIFYSLGNFVFDQMWSEETREGLTITITTNDNRITKINLKPVIIENYCCPRWANDDETTAILKKLNLTNPILFSQN